MPQRLELHHCPKPGHLNRFPSGSRVGGPMGGRDRKPTFTAFQTNSPESLCPRSHGFVGVFPCRRRSIADSMGSYGPSPSPRGTRNRAPTLACPERASCGCSFSSALSRRRRSGGVPGGRRGGGWGAGRERAGPQAVWVAWSQGPGPEEVKPSVSETARRSQRMNPGKPQAIKIEATVE